jgi:CHAT domain-containing protein
MTPSSKRLRLVWLLALACALSPAAAASPWGQGGDVLSRESDEGALTEEERRQALAVLTAAARSSLDAGEPSAAARFLNRAGRLQLRLNRPAESLAAYREALSALGRSPDVPTRVNSLNGMAAAHAHQSERAAAESLLRQALALSEEGGYVVGKAEALLILSDCQNSDDHRLALKTAQESLALWQSAGHKWGVGRTYSAIGQYQMEMNDLEGAAQSHQAALEIWRQLDLRDELAEALINLGFVEYRRGAWQNSISFHTQAQALLDGKSDPYRMGQVTGGMGETFVESGMTETGLAKFRESLEYFRQARSPYAVAALSIEIGRTLYLTGDYPGAFAALRQARTDAEAIGQNGFIALCYEYLGSTYAATGDSEAALEHYRTALRVYERVGMPMQAARTAALMGRVYEQEGKLGRARELKFGKAIGLYKKSVETFRRLSVPVNEAATLYALGGLELEMGDLEAADEHLRQSIEATENVRRGSAGTDLTAAFSATVHERYEKYVECLMRRHRADTARGFDARAFEAVELARGRSLADWLRAIGTNLIPGLDPRLAEQEHLLRQSLRVNDEKRVALLGDKDKRKEVEALGVELARLETEYGRVEEAIRARHPAYAQVVGAPGWDLGRIQRQILDDETLLLEYVLGVERSYVWAVTRGGLKSYELPPRELIGSAAARAYKLLATDPGAGDGEGATEAVRELSRMVLSPVAEELRGRRRVIVVADGALNYVPFQIMSASSDGGGDPLVAAYEVVNAPSASVLGQLREEAARRRPHARTLAAFGDPVFLSNYAMRKGAGPGPEVAALRRMEEEGIASRLRDVPIEGDSLNPATARPLFFAALELANLRAAAAGADTLVASGFDATPERLQATDLSDFAILHFATHGSLDPLHPEKSGLLLSTVDTEGRERPGFVGLRDIYSLRAPVGLVVLSACRTALGKEVPGEGMIGLTRGFMYAGASSVVSSLWKVNDEATSELMKRFYENMLRRGMTPAEALGAAQNSIRQGTRWRSPYYWAAFTLQGEYRQVVRPAPAASPYTKAAVSAGALSLLACAAWWLKRRRARVALD